jgi:hypothetical protein
MTVYRKNVHSWHETDMPMQSPHVRCRGQCRHAIQAEALLFWTQTVWKRFSYPNNYKQLGAMDLEATG